MDATRRLESGYEVYNPVFGILTAIVPTVARFDSSPFRRFNVTVLDESVVHVTLNGCPGVRFVVVMTEVITFAAEAYAMKTKTTILASDNIIQLKRWKKRSKAKSSGI